MKGIVRALALAGIAGIVGCAAPDDEADRYRSALPEQGSVALAVPGPSGGGGIRTLDLSNGGGGTASDAEFYRLSRDLTDAIDRSTAQVLGIVWAVAQTTPTRVESNRITWGPGRAHALEPVVWRLVVTEVASGEYDYSVDGRPKDSTSDDDFRSVVRGRGYGEGHALHHSGWFEVLHEVYRSLDPPRSNDRGTAKVTYDLRQYPKTIGAVGHDEGGARWIDANVQHLQEGAGILDLVTQGDVEKPGEKDGNFETVVFASKWIASGAGRADVSVSGGSLPVELVEVVECWSESFTRSYYKDSLSLNPETGAVSACPAF